VVMSPSSKRDVRTASASAVASEVMTRTASGRLTVFAGAYVSCMAPAGLPMAAPLKWGLVEALWVQASALRALRARPWAQCHVA
jgi:hypothetical protein